MINPETAVMICLIGYGIIGVIYILAGASRTEKHIFTHYGMTEVLWGLLLLGIAIIGWVI